MLAVLFRKADPIIDIKSAVEELTNVLQRKPKDRELAGLQLLRHLLDSVAVPVHALLCIVHSAAVPVAAFICCSIVWVQPVV